MNKSDLEEALIDAGWHRQPEVSWDSEEWRLYEGDECHILDINALDHIVHISTNTPNDATDHPVRVTARHWQPIMQWLGAMHPMMQEW